MFKFTIVLCIVIFPLVYSYKSTSIFKITKVYCESFDESLAVINLCRLRAIRRNISKMYLNITLLQKFYDINVNLDFRRKANGFKPFLYNITVDACAFMRKKKSPFANLVYNLFKDYSNINHTCPYYGDQIMDGFYPKVENVLHNLPVPSGEYALYLNWIMNKSKLFVTYYYFDFNGE